MNPPPHPHKTKLHTYRPWGPAALGSRLATICTRRQGSGASEGGEGRGHAVDSPSPMPAVGRARCRRPCASMRKPTGRHDRTTTRHATAGVPRAVGWQPPTVHSRLTEKCGERPGLIGRKGARRDKRSRRKNVSATTSQRMRPEEDIATRLWGKISLVLF